MTKVNLSHTQDDFAYMKMALDLSRRGLGQVAPNPSVGCVLVKNNHIIGRGWTGVGGRPHAEANALHHAGDASGASAYVTLEPCAHFGKTPPCAEGLVKAGVRKVIIATGDPDERVSGKGIAILEEAGIEVCLGLLKAEADLINQGFFQKVTLNRPLVTVKLATSKDGKIAQKEDEQTWVTGPEARKRGHLLRANHDAIMVGINTVIVDDPSLDCRISGLQDRSPIRIVLDSELRLPIESKLCDTSTQPTWVMTASRDAEKTVSLKNRGVKVFSISKLLNGGLDLNEVMAVLAKEGITRLLSEGGGRVNASLLKAGIVDRIMWFKSSKTIGETGVNALYDIPLADLDQFATLKQTGKGVVGSDHWHEFNVIR